MKVGFIFSLMTFALGFSILAHDAAAKGASGFGEVDPDKYYANELAPFSSDGCSRYAEGTSSNTKQWNHCCLQHDVIYWQGGTQQQRRDADEALNQCVADTGATFRAFLMWLGVRVGGSAKINTSWSWGYGWNLDRGYGPLEQAEKNQVDQGLAIVPANLNDVVTKHAPTRPQRKSVTGDFCLDSAIGRVYTKLGRPFKITETSSELHYNSGRWLRSIKIVPNGCGEPFQFSFDLAGKNDCSRVVVDVWARVQSVTEPESCK